MRALQLESEALSSVAMSEQLQYSFRFGSWHTIMAALAVVLARQPFLGGWHHRLLYGTILAAVLWLWWWVRVRVTTDYLEIRRFTSMRFPLNRAGTAVSFRGNRLTVSDADGRSACTTLMCTPWGQRLQLVLIRNTVPWACWRWRVMRERIVRCAGPEVVFEFDDR